MTEPPHHADDTICKEREMDRGQLLLPALVIRGIYLSSIVVFIPKCC